MQELYHADHGNNKLTTILFTEKPPSDPLKVYLKQMTFESRVVILEGNPLVFSNLFRASIETTKCAIILADKNTEDAEEEDKKVACLQADYYEVLCFEEFPGEVFQKA